MMTAIESTGQKQPKKREIARPICKPLTPLEATYGNRTDRALYAHVPTNPVLTPDLY